MAEQMGISGEKLQDLAVCALLHDNALTQYIQEELHNDITDAKNPSRLGVHCIMGEKNIQWLPFHTDVKTVILYHHENANGFLQKVRGGTHSKESSFGGTRSWQLPSN